MVQGVSTGSGAQWEGEASNGGKTIDVEDQGGGRNGRTREWASELGRSRGQVVVPAYLRADLSAHGFYKRGTTVMFDIWIVNLDAVSYLLMTPKKELANSEKDKKDKYLQDYLERRCSFTSMVYSVDGITGVEA